MSTTHVPGPPLSSPFSRLNRLAMPSTFALHRATRALWRFPAITILAVVALGLGIGLPTAMFSIVDAAVLRGLPVANAERIMHLERRAAGTRGEGIGAMPRDYLAWQTQQKSFNTLGAFRSATVTLRVGSNVDRWHAAFVTPNTFGILGTRPMLGRLFTDADGTNSAAATIVLSYTSWRDRYSSDATLVGRTIFVDGVARSVIGIMPKDFRFPADEDAWLPLIMPATNESDAQFAAFDVFGALRDGVSKDAAAGEFAVIARRMAQTFPTTNRALDITVKPFTERFMGENATAQIYVILAAVLLVLLVACANVANLLLVRAVHRSREVAISMALGASRGRIVTGIVIESALLAIVGSALGIVIAQLSIMGMMRAFVSKLPYWVQPRLDVRVMLFALVLTVLAAILAAVLPAVRTTVGDLSRTLRDDSRGNTSVDAGRIMKTLVIIELALSMVLLVNTGLLALGAARARNIDMGISRTALFSADVSVPESYTVAERMNYFGQLEERLRNESSIADAGLITALPGTHAEFRRVMLDGVAYQNKQDIPSTRYAAASASLFAALKVAPLQGRLIEPHDIAGNEPVAVVNERFVRQFFPNENAIGHRIRIGTSDSIPWRRIVGVVPNLWMGAFDASPERNPSGVYVPLAQTAAASVSIAALVKRGQPLSVTATVRNIAFSVNPEIPISNARDMPQLIDDGTWFYEMAAGILAVCGASALLLATVGVYGVIAFSVGRRRREFGVRVALGADARSIVRLVLRKGFAQVAIGVVIGAVLAELMARSIGSLNFEASSFHPLLFVSVAFVLATVAAAAMLIPTVGASRVQPLEALRAE